VYKAIGQRERAEVFLGVGHTRVWIGKVGCLESRGLYSESVAVSRKVSPWYTVKSSSWYSGWGSVRLRREARCASTPCTSLRKTQGRQQTQMALTIGVLREWAGNVFVRVGYRLDCDRIMEWWVCVGPST
jgi:hypothetical protein